MLPVPWPGIEPTPPALEAQNLNHWKSLSFLLCIFRCGFFFPCSSSGCSPRWLLCKWCSCRVQVGGGELRVFLLHLGHTPWRHYMLSNGQLEPESRSFTDSLCVCVCVCEEWKLMWVIQFQEKTEQKGHKKWANVLSVFVFYLNISPIFKFLSLFISFNVVFMYIDLKCLHFYVKNCFWNNDFWKSFGVFHICIV